MSKFECKECKKVFESAEALKHHNNSKHYQPKKLNFSSKKIKKYSIILGVILVLVLISWFMVLQDQKPGEYDEFATCLNESGAVFYGAFWCPHCSQQKAMFGKSFDFVNYVECSNPDGRTQTQACIDAGIEGYPTWRFANDTERGGTLSLNELSEITGCSLE